MSTFFSYLFFLFAVCILIKFGDKFTSYQFMMAMLFFSLLYVLDRIKDKLSDIKDTLESIEYGIEK